MSDDDLFQTASSWLAKRRADMGGDSSHDAEIVGQIVSAHKTLWQKWPLPEKAVVLPPGLPPEQCEAIGAAVNDYLVSFHDREYEHAWLTVLSTAMALAVLLTAPPQAGSAAN